MGDIVFSRSYLQGLPEEAKIAEVSRLISSFTQNLLYAATIGRTNFFFDMTKIQYIPQSADQNIMKQSIISAINPHYRIPIDEILPLFQERFADCTVTYQEQWVETKDNNKALKKGILIDWS